jgi:alanyl-tRNA synthetase
MQSSEIRKTFWKWFTDRGHTLVPSSPLIPANDPTLYFTNAGMVQFKDVFTGVEQRPYSRAVTAQRCMRVAGKHNDLEEVGRTARHHTLFEMLGNFSFGDYFKEEAIKLAWGLLTEGYQLDPDRLWVTVFEDDDEAFELWRGIGFPEARLQRLGARDNFWSMGDTGPCGPCSEIHWDHGPSISDDTRGPAGESDRYVEIWNLVFMQFEQHADGSRENLPRPSVDTGMGLERLAAIKQGVYWNYDTDLFQGVIGRAAELAGVKYGQSGQTDTALRVIADHSRAAAFLVGDGVVPSNVERGYVLRRIMRRGIRFGVKLGLEEPFLWQTAGAVIDKMGEAYPELVERRGVIEEVIRAEEESFGRTLDRGLGLLDKEIAAERERGGGRLAGPVVFQLHDTFGFPPDLTRQIAEEHGMDIDAAGYEEAMEAQRAAGRAAWKGSGEQQVDRAHHALAAELGATEFLGYEADEGTGVVRALLRGGEVVDALSEGGEGEIVVDRTPFYAESGGQVGDTGAITLPGGYFVVSDTRKGPGGVFFHQGRLERGEVRVGDTAHLLVEGARRDRTRLNHTATHLLHAALKRVLGEHVEQKGSLVEPERLRFDFSHHKPVTDEQLEAIEDMVYAHILSNDEVTTELMDLDDALASGATALFGEKYDQKVRVLSVSDFSVELCGGTHAARTGDIGLFKLTGESGVAAGVRRIEAVTGPGALRYVRERDRVASAAAQRLKSSVDGLADAVERSISDRRRLEKELEALKRELARAAASDLASNIREINGVKVLVAEVPGDARVLQAEADRLRDQLGSGLVVLGSREGGKVMIIAAVTKDLAGKRLHAGKIIKEIAAVVGGGGGGKPDMARAGGKDPDALPRALEKVYELV